MSGASARQAQYGVFPHAELGAMTGRGYVVRLIHADGTAIDQHNYRGVFAVSVFVRKTAAEKCAARYNLEAMPPSK